MVSFPWRSGFRVLLATILLLVLPGIIRPVLATEMKDLLAGGTQNPPPAPPPSSSGAEAIGNDAGPATSDPARVDGTMAPQGPAVFPGGRADLVARPPGDPPAVFGIIGLRGFFFGDHVASNGVEFRQLFSLDSNFNIWLWRTQGVYAFIDTRFWGQKAAPGITNSNQGAFDFSKREFDLVGGVAWNFCDQWEARLWAYSYNNLNRGDSTVRPSGFNDGMGLECRYYLSDVYRELGTAEYDIARATFVSAGYYPTKDMVDNSGNSFKPGAFIRAYLTFDLLSPRYYLFTDSQFLTDRMMTPKMIFTDTGLAARPFETLPRLEFRLGTEDFFDLHGGEPEYSGYVSIRYIY